MGDGAARGGRRRRRALVELLLSLGADPSLRDARFGATPLDWARHLGPSAVVDLLDEMRDAAGQAQNADHTAIESGTLIPPGAFGTQGGRSNRTTPGRSGSTR